MDGPDLFELRVRAKDDRGQFVTSSATSLTVPNAAPTGTLRAAATLDEGGTWTVTLVDPFDPSGLDTNAGFHYAFALDAESLAGVTYANSASSHSRDYTLDNSGDHALRVRILDKDDDFTEYSAIVHVNDGSGWLEVKIDDRETAIKYKGNSSPSSLISGILVFSGAGNDDIRGGDGADILLFPYFCLQPRTVVIECL